MSEYDAQINVWDGLDRPGNPKLLNYRGKVTPEQLTIIKAVLSGIFNCAHCHFGFEDGSSWYQCRENKEYVPTPPFGFCHLWKPEDTPCPTCGGRGKMYHCPACEVEMKCPTCEGMEK
jgi:rubrerythrin